MTARLPTDPNPEARVPETAGTVHAGDSLEEFIDLNREDLEALAEKDYPISPVVRALLDRHDRGED